MIVRVIPSRADGEGALSCKLGYPRDPERQYGVDAPSQRGSGAACAKRAAAIPIGRQPLSA